jgi:hypothetical protein
LRQALLDGRNDDFHPRFAVVVAAYDRLPDDQQKHGPGSYLRSNFPLLSQYINSNREEIDIQVFGVSIAGGDFIADQQFKEKYLKGRPDEAGYVIYDSGSGIVKSTDLTLPVFWALSKVQIDELNKP